jgi:uncharacterized membrane protein (UPF0127 family)
MKKYCILLVLWFLFACSCQSKPRELPVNYITIKNKRVKVEIAATLEARMKGLMQREKLDADSGMLFVYAKEDHLRFWMKNTFIPLSIAFIKSDGTITQIKSMIPKNEETVWSVTPVKYALEMNKDWFEFNDINVGDKVIIPDNIQNIGVE